MRRDRFDHKVDRMVDHKVPDLQRVEVITGVGRRRSWPSEFKVGVVADSLEPDAVISEVAGRHGKHLARAALACAVDMFFIATIFAMGSAMPTSTDTSVRRHTVLRARREWSQAEKRSIVAVTRLAGANISAISRRHGAA
jgi:transposase-like protein